MTEAQKKELIEIFKEIQDFQMNNIQLARTTKVYKLAETGLSILNQKKQEDLCTHEKQYYCLITGGARCRKCKKCI